MLRPSVFQVVPQDNHTVMVHFDDGRIKVFDAKQLIKKGGIFAQLENIQFFKERCAVLNHTLAWDVSGNLDPSECIDVCPDVIYEDSLDYIEQ